MKIKIKTPYITLGALLKFSGVCETGAQAKEMIQEGLCFVNGEPDLRRGRKIYPGDVVEADTIQIMVESL